MGESPEIKAGRTMTGEGPAPSRAERREQQIQRIMEAAKLCFVRYGFQGASMHEICAEAGMSPGALYRYFSSKEAIIEAITAEDQREDVATFQLMKGLPVVDGLVAVAMAHVRRIHQLGSAPLFAEIRAESMRNPIVARCCDEGMSQASAMVVPYIEAAAARGEIRPVADPGVLTAMLMALGQGLMLNDPLGQGFDADRIEAIVRAMTEAVVRPNTGAKPNDSGE